MNQNLQRQIEISALAAIVVVALYHFLFISPQKNLDGLEYKGWHRGDYVLITSRSLTRAKPSGLPFFEYSWCRIEEVSDGCLKVRTFYGTDDGDARNDSMTNPSRLGEDGASNIDFEKIRNIIEWPKSYGPKRPIWIF